MVYRPEEYSYFTDFTFEIEDCEHTVEVEIFGYLDPGDPGSYDSPPYDAYIEHLEVLFKGKDISFLLSDEQLEMCEELLWREIERQSERGPGD